MNNNPLVSIIIPNYNHARFLDERMQSILNQTFSDFEIIFLDDCSTDNSLEVINKYRKDKRFKEVVVNEKNSGSPFKQWEKGIALAKGEFVWIAESDDSCEASFLEKNISVLNSNKNISFSFSLSRRMNIDGEKKEVIQQEFGEDIVLNGIDFIRKHMLFTCTVMNASSALFKKNKALSINKQFQTYRHSGDWLFWIEMAEKGDVAIISQPLNYYRIYGSNTTSRGKATGKSDVEAYNVYEYLEDKGWLSWTDKLRIKKKNICYIKYFNNYHDDSTRKQLISMWKPSLITEIIAYVSYLRQR